MERREFLQTFAASLAAGMVTGAPVLAAGESWQQSFATALQRNPWLLGYKGVKKDFERHPMQVEGKVPAALRGVLYRNGPAQHEIGDMRYHHWFDGDGMVHAFHINDGTPYHIGRFIETAKRKEETAAGHFIEQGFGTNLPGMRQLSSGDQGNTANINVIQHNGELLALWEGGSAYRLDPETLETLGLKTWSNETFGLPFSAHPRLDTDGTLWNFGYAPTQSALVLYRISSSGKLLDTGVIRLDKVPMVHDFIITEKSIVLVLPPFDFDRSRNGSFLDHFTWEPERGGRALVIDKANLSTYTEIDIPAFWVFHFANAFEDQNGLINFQAPIYPSPSIMTKGLKVIMRGEQADPYDMGLQSLKMASMQLDLNKKSLTMDYLDGAARSEFPRVDNRRQGQRNHYTVAMQNVDEQHSPTFQRVLRIDNNTGAIASFQYASSELPEEHFYIPHPRSDSEDKGWIIGTSLDYLAKRTTVNIFEAASLANGQVARLHVPYPLPLGLHGSFVSAA